MIAGSKDRFAIEAEPDEIVDGWVLGRFRFWIDGESVGNWDDAADLTGCDGWLRDFAFNPRDRFEASMERAEVEEVFRRVYDQVTSEAECASAVRDAVARFHISYLSM